MIASYATNLSQVGRFGRRFLLFNTFNSIAWQCLVGSVLVLFARRIDMPARYVGLLLSFMPLSMILVGLSVPLIDRFGPRRLMPVVWFLRTVATTPVFLIPWAISRGGVQAGWLVLAISTFGFCLFRAFGAGAWFPWMHQMLPAQSRGVYFSLEQAMYQMVNIVIAFVIANVLGSHDSVRRYLGVEAFGMLAGIFSIYLITRVPGGEKPEKFQGSYESFNGFIPAFRNRRYMRFILTGSLGICALAWLGSAYVLYMRDVLHYSSRHIMLLLGIGGIGIASSIAPWGEYADRHGSGKAMSLTLAGFSVGALCWILLPPTAPWTNVAVWPAIGVSMIFMAAYQMASNRGMLCQIPEEGRAVYSSIWLMSTALAWGLTPILVGQIIDRFGEPGYRFCFCMAGLSGLLCAAACRRIREDEEQPEKLREILKRPVQPLETAWQITSITLGLNKRRSV